MPPRLCATNKIGSCYRQFEPPIRVIDCTHLVSNLPLEAHCKVSAVLRHAVLVVRLEQPADCICIWDPAIGRCISTLEGHSRSVWSVAWSHDATRLASASNDNTIKIWDPATGLCVSTLGIDSVLYDLQFHESNSKIGTFDLRTAAISTVFGPACTDCPSPVAVGYGLSSSGTWITYQGKNLLRLPP